MNNAASRLREFLEKNYSKDFELDVGTNNIVLLTVVSSKFEGKSREARLEPITNILNKEGLMPGIIELYTPQEAIDSNIAIRTQSDEINIFSWEDAISKLVAGQNISPLGKRDHPIKRVVFYSYKGGVGRTTALLQTAFQLARDGKRVVVIDMDVEAPGLQALMPPPEAPIEVGLIDFLWERHIRFFDDAHPPLINLTESNQGRGIIYRAEDPQSRRDLFIVPAGKIGAQYIQRLSALTVSQLFNPTEDAWYQFEQELWRQFQPDIMLIDARTGLSEWGGLSLLRLADEAFIVLYPSEQNAEGVRFIREILDALGGISHRLVLSPVPEGIIGSALVNKIKPFLNLQEDEEVIPIPYHPSIAGSDKFPIEIALPYYAPIANILLESSGIEKAAEILAQHHRLDLIKSLSFPERSAESILGEDFDAIFTKTGDFERCLEDSTWVIRGRKGTGKSTLYKLFTQHKRNAEKRVPGRLDDISIISGHGPSYEFTPKTDTFLAFHKVIDENQLDWLSLWRAYAIINIYNLYPEFQNVLKKSKLSPLISQIKNFSQESNGKWLSKHTKRLTDLIKDQALNGLCRDAIIALNQWLRDNNQKLWLVYDDLDQDIQENSPWQQEALGGLMRFAYDANNQGLYHIRFKIFIREDIWANLVFTNKSHFGESRTFLLKWEKEDFFRLAYRLAVGGSIAFKHFANRVFPLTESDFDDADEETLRKALAPLWGLRQKSKNAYIAQWVYTRLTDSSGNTYPRSLTILLKKAREVELKQKQGKTSPLDHLLRWKSLTDGLEAASVERCEAIKQEYSDLAPFFAEIHRLRSLVREEDLKSLWKDTLSDKFQTFDGFVKHVESIGIIEKKTGKFDYAIANLYIDGFGITRTPGQRK